MKGIFIFVMVLFVSVVSCNRKGEDIKVNATYSAPEITTEDSVMWKLSSESDTKVVIKLLNKPLGRYEKRECLFCGCEFYIVCNDSLSNANNFKIICPQCGRAIKK